MVAVAVRKHGEIDLLEIDAERFGVFRELAGVTTRIKEDRLALKPNQNRIAPTELRSRRFFAESVIEVQNDTGGIAGGSQ